jgi:hypothetical protein
MFSINLYVYSVYFFLLNNQRFIPSVIQRVKAVRNVQRERKLALDVFQEFPEGEIFAIPVGLDDCEIPYEKFRSIERVDLFPDWDEGIQRLLRTFEIH